jgi:hypothetical protein
VTDAKGAPLSRMQHKSCALACSCYMMHTAACDGCVDLCRGCAAALCGACVGGCSAAMGFDLAVLGGMLALPGAAGDDSAGRQCTCAHRLGLMLCICHLRPFVASTEAMTLHPDVCCWW